MRKPKRPVSNDIQTLTEVIRDRLSGVVICLSHAWGGLEQVAAADAMQLHRQGLNVKVFCLEGSPTHEYLKGHSDIRIQTLKQSPRNYFDIKMKQLIQKWVEVDQVNLIHTHQTSLLGSLTPWLWGKPNIVLIASRHIMNNHNKKDLFHSLIYRRLDALLVMSEALKRNVLLTHNLKERQVRIVRLGINFKSFIPEEVDSKVMREQWGADSDTVVIGLVGRIDPAKGQATFLRAAAGLCQNIPKSQKVKFVMVGAETVGSTNYTDKLKELLKVYQLTDQVVFAGFLEDIPKVMAAFDILVMPSRKEAFGMVAIEGMAMECPVIVSNAGSAQEIVGNDEYGLLVRPDDAYDLQKKLRWFLENPASRKEMGKKARAFVKSHFDVQIRLQNTLEIYERMLRMRKVH